MSLTTRAIVAILLMVGFYVFAIALAVGLLLVPVAEYHYFDRIELRTGVACVVAGCVILWSMIPRRDKFQVPGPAVTEEQQPQLLAELKTIAQRAGQEMPHEVYFIPDINAWVAQRGGVMGVGSRRVMGLGLPLMRLLTVSQFRAVVAHEFGHYYSGDTALGPWIYQTRASIFRTVAQLAKAKSIITILFRWYARMFMRVTLAISRAQEYAADRIAAEIAGGKSTTEGLKQIHFGAAAWRSYLQTEVGPLLKAGYSPPLSEGLHSFLSVAAISKAAGQILAKELASGKAEPYDSHPALAERIAALKGFASDNKEDTRPATDLLVDYFAADTTLFLTAPGKQLRPIRWEETLETVYIASWRREVEARRESIQGSNVFQMGKDLYTWELRNRLKAPKGIWPTNDQRDLWAKSLAGSAISLTLMNDGWTIKTAPGEAIRFEKNGKIVKPFEVVARIGKGELKHETWEKFCAEMGIGDLPAVMDSKQASASASS